MQSVLVTGGAGFIGSHLSDELLRQGYKVIILDNLSNGRLQNLNLAIEHPHCTFVEGDILDLTSLDLPPFDIVFHLACLGVRHSLNHPLANHEVNATGTLRLLEYCIPKRIHHFFYISTSEVYGNTTAFPIRETSLTYPTTVYGGSKLAGEHYTSAMCQQHGISFSILRLFNNFGPRAHHEGDAGELIPRSIIKVLTEQSPIIFGDGSVTRDFLYVGDTVKLLTEALAQATQSQTQERWDGLTLNLGYGKEWSILEVVKKIIGLINPNIPIDFKTERPADVPRLWVDNSLMKKYLKTQIQCDLAHGLSPTIEYYKKILTHQDLLEEMDDINF